MPNKKNKHTALNDHHNIYGIGFMLLHAVSIAALYAVIKFLTKDISSHLAVFLYKLMILVSILPWCFKDGLKGIKTDRIWLHASRGFLSICGSLCLFYAIKHIELSDITAVGYLEQVIMVLIGIFYFKEKGTISKFVGILLSFLGAVIVVYPQLAEFHHHNFIPDFFFKDTHQAINPYYAFVFLSIAFWATNATVVKVLGKTEKTKVQLFYVNLFSCIIAFPLAFMKWQAVAHLGALEIKLPMEFFAFSELNLKTSHIPILVVLALCYFTHSIAFFLALKYAEMSTVVPFDYSRLVFAGILGLLIFEEIPSNGSYYGYALIIISGVFLVRAESKRRKKLTEAKIKDLESELEHA